MTYQDLIQKIRDKEKFDFARMGDGEWNAVFRDRKSTQNCDGHSYFPTLGKRLKAILDSKPNYYIGLQNLAYRQRKEQIDTFDIDWCRSDILHYESIKRGLKGLFEALATRDVLLVGGNHLHKLAVKEGWYFVEIPHKNCWLEYDQVMLDINALVGLKDWVILYAASMMSGVLIDDFAGQCTQVDVGSVFDPYVGIQSRSYMKNLKL